MQAVVLVGGFGTRLRPLTLHRPKQMLPACGVPMIEHVIAGLARHGVTEAILSLGYRPDAFIDAYPDGTCAGVKLTYAVEPEPLDTAGAVRFAALAAGVTDRFLAVNGDVVTDMDVTALVAFHEKSGAEATISLTPVDDPSRYGVVPTDDDGRVLGFIEKPPPGEAPTNWINAGAYVLEPSVLDRIADGRKVSIERETFPALAAQGTLFALGSDAYWVDAGTPATYLDIQLDLIDGRRGSPWPAVDPGSTVSPDATVDRAIIGAGAVIEAGARVERSMIGAGTRVGADAIVADSIIDADVVIGEGASVLELTVIGRGEQVPAGARLADDRVPPPDTWPPKT
ncbi:MAG: NDP-sugar synthase [Acidimicrobiales bacterium]|nr:NDP-sugar synthase [Acidimicrobiales bacterium]